MYGIFFEDINFAADGGLYAELIKNRSSSSMNLDRLETTQYKNTFSQFRFRFFDDYN
jgi:hypothetical protein